MPELSLDVGAVSLGSSGSLGGSTGSGGSVPGAEDYSLIWGLSLLFWGIDELNWGA